MSNELVGLLIFLIWLKSGRGLNLCLLIFAYYVLYEISHVVFYNILQLKNSEIYFISQILIDFCILYSCLLLAYKNVKRSFTILIYGFVVFSSLTIEGLRLVDEVSQSRFLVSLYDSRQEFSHSLDLLFALLGSGKNGLVNDIGLFIRGCRVYNRDNNPKADIEDCQR